MARATPTPNEAVRPAPQVAVPEDVRRKNQKEIDRLLKPQRPRRMSIIGLLVAFVLAGGAAFATASVIRPDGAASIASVGGPSSADVDGALARGKQDGYAKGVSEGRATEKKAAKKREEKRFRQGYTKGLREGRDDGKRKGYTEGYRTASETYASAVAQATGQLAQLQAENERLRKELAKKQEQPPPGGDGQGGADTTATG